MWVLRTSIMARKSTETTANVRAVPTAEDQQQINQFARLHKSYLEFTEKLATLNNQDLNLGEAADEVMLLDDEFTNSIPLQIGSVFVHYDQETINQKLEERKEITQQQIEQLKERIAGIETEMNKLRTILYAKFGDNIQLEDENREGEIVGV